MKPLMKTLFMLLLATALLAACGDDTGSDVAVDSNDEATDPEEAVEPKDENNEGLDVSNEENVTEDEEANEEEDSSSDLAEDQQLTLGETGLRDTTYGSKQEITLNNVRAEDEVEGESPSNDLFIIAEVTITNISDESVDTYHLTEAELWGELGTGYGPVWADGFEGELEPGEAITGELIFDQVESSYYELVYGSAVHSNINEVRWKFDADEIE